MKCKNCGHRVIRISVNDTPEMRDSDSFPYTHVIHGEEGDCKVLGCGCSKVELEEEE